MPTLITEITINTTTRILYLINLNNILQNYPIAVGKPSTPTPRGIYSVINKIINPGGMLGTRWLGLDIPDGVYGIHGTNSPDSIGKAISNGCIRLHNQAIETLFPYVSVGTRVKITADKDTYNKEAPFANQHSYTVQVGDSLWLIAKKFNLPLGELIKANPLIDPDKIHPGQTVVIP